MSEEYRRRHRARRVAFARDRISTAVPETLYSIAGNIVDALAAALESVVVTVYTDAQKTQAVSTTTTDASGDFSFPAGFQGSTSYYVEAVLTGYTADNDPLTVAISSANVTDADFVLTAD